MLRKNRTKKVKDESGGTYVIVASRYNAMYVDAMLRAAREELLKADARVRIIRVPGAFEIPAVVARLAHKSANRKTLHGAPLSAILCLGVIFQGETPHAQHISWGVTHALAQIQVLYRVPVVHGVYLFEKVKHARVRCLGTKHNRGSEAAHTALEMARVMSAIH
jgi:6,7-dimethyl-8-ribityllumazine synthase